jgi:hypothetical protein
MNKHTAYIIYRVLMRIHDLASFAFLNGREEDARSMWRIIGRLEYMHFEGITTEQSLLDMTAIDAGSSWVNKFVMDATTAVDATDSWVNKPVMDARSAR